MWFGLHIMQSAKSDGVFQSLKLLKSIFEQLGVHIQAALILTHLGDVVGLVKNDDAVVEVNIEVFSEVLVN